MELDDFQSYCLNQRDLWRITCDSLYVQIIVTASSGRCMEKFGAAGQGALNYVVTEVGLGKFSVPRAGQNCQNLIVWSLTGEKTSH